MSRDAFIYRDGKIEPFEDWGLGRGYVEPIEEPVPFRTWQTRIRHRRRKLARLGTRGRRGAKRIAKQVYDIAPLSPITIQSWRRYVEHRFAAHKTIVEFGKVTYVPIKEAVLYLPSDMVLTSEIEQEMIVKLEGRRT